MPIDVRFLLSLRNAEDLLHVRCIDVCHTGLRLWVDRWPGWFKQLLVEA